MSGDRRRLAVHVITGLSTGGAEMMLYRLTLALQPLGWDSRVICLNGGGAVADRLETAGTEVVRLDIRNVASLLSGLVRMVRILRAWHPQAVHTWLYHADLLGGLAARLAGTGCIVWSIRNSRLRVRGGIGKRLLPRVCAPLSYLVPHRIVACANAAVEAHAGLGYDRRRIVMVPNGFDPDAFRPDPSARARLHREWGVAADERVIGVVGRFDVNKGYEILFPALRRLREGNRRFKVMMAGTGMSYENRELEKLVDQHGLGGCVRLLGPRDDMPALYSGLDLLVSSSVSEGFPNVIAEAMLCNCAVVATDVGDTRQIIDRYGRVVPPGDPAVLADAVQAVLDLDRTMLNGAGELGREHIVKYFSINVTAARYAAVYAECGTSVRNRRIH